MKLTAAELACVRSQGLYLTEKCDQGGKPLNRAVRYTTLSQQAKPRTETSLIGCA